MDGIICAMPHSTPVHILQALDEATSVNDNTADLKLRQVSNNLLAFLSGWERACLAPGKRLRLVK